MTPSTTDRIAKLGFDQPLVECVPNISEGRNELVIRRIAGAASSVEGIRLLHIDKGSDAHRTVVTFAGPASAILEAAWRFAKATFENLDMRNHRGEHRRIGALDVFPFVPLEGTTMEQCVSLAEALGERIGVELGVPVYLYEEAARIPERRALPQVRGKGYETLEHRLKSVRWRPDFGPAQFHSRSGAAIVGARKILVAFNIGLMSSDVAAAQRIAERIRSSGTSGKPGRLAEVRAVGWMMPTYSCAQVSTNILDWQQTGLYDVFEACREEAAGEGIELRGSELIGLLPEAALLDVAQRLGVGGSGDDALAAAVQYLGLNAFSPFVLEERLLERAWRRRAPEVTRDLSG
ncbi:MAG: glutamate formimidoyltransferase [Bdellovibrionales bacterium]|nr:glutamate formimidoyltransferase [Bdellovibrionales bacterium]